MLLLFLLGKILNIYVGSGRFSDMFTIYLSIPMQLWTIVGRAIYLIGAPRSIHQEPLPDKVILSSTGLPTAFGRLTHTH